MKLDITQITVLIVDDDATLRKAVARMLPMLGYEPLHAGSAEEAVQVLGSQQVDLMLLDLQLPGVHGHALLRNMNQQNIPIPVVMMSGIGTMDDVVQALRQHAVDFLNKPFSMEELSAALERAKARRPRADAPTDAGAETRAAAPTSTPAAATQANEKRAPSPSQQGIRPAVRKMLEELRAGTLKLPVMDPRLATIQSVMERPDASIDDAVEVVGGDPVVAASVLRQANSSYYRLQAKVRNLREACVRLGSKKVFSIAIEVLYKKQFDVKQEPHRTILSNMWRNMYISARCCGRLCTLLQRQDAEEMYLAALLHNAGEMLVIQLLVKLGKASADEDYLESVAREVSRIHQPMGAALARSWGLPELVQRLTAHHHQPRSEPEPAPRRVERNLVLAAWSLAMEAGFTYLPGQDDNDLSEHLSALGLTEVDVEELLQEATSWLVE